MPLVSAVLVCVLLAIVRACVREYVCVCVRARACVCVCVIDVPAIGSIHIYI